MVAKVLFLLKFRTTPWNYCDGDPTAQSPPSSQTNLLSSGLYNSARLVVEMLKGCGVDTHLEHCVDGNSIDRLVTKMRPTHVILEAYWVTPAKLEELTRLHPTVKWVIRNHSRVPFMACEGQLMGWSLEYATLPNVFIASNTENTTDDLSYLIDRECSIYLPNYYLPRPLSETKHFAESDDLMLWHRAHRSRVINIGCFGAIRPLKNQLQQAISAIRFANSNGYQLNFHINGGRAEVQGDQPLKNIRQMFQHQKHHRLIEHPWLDHSAFTQLIRQMDVLMQCSFTETFNIVTADAVTEGVPIVVSPEIFWADSATQVDPTNSADICLRLETLNGMTMADFKDEHARNHRNLTAYCDASVEAWLSFFSFLSGEDDCAPTLMTSGGGAGPREPKNECTPVEDKKCCSIL